MLEMVQLITKMEIFQCLLKNLVMTSPTPTFVRFDNNNIDKKINSMLVNNTVEISEITYQIVINLSHLFLVLIYSTHIYGWINTDQLYRHIWDP